MVISPELSPRWQGLEHNVFSSSWPSESPDD
jgi:hypothetical protein